MKHSYIYAAMAIATTFGSHAHAYSPMVFANGVSARNIGAIQHSVMLGAMEYFEGSAAAALGPRGRFPFSGAPAHNHDNDGMPHHRYGEIAHYGTMPMYGEYGDDGTIFMGRSGGDMPRKHAPTMNNVWLAWQHYGDDAKYSNLQKTDSRYDLIMMGLSAQRAQIQGGVSEWGMFGGYVGGIQENDYFEIHENGGYVGVYNGYNIHQFGVALALNAGALYNDADGIDNGMSDEYANMWIGAAANVKYNIRMNDAFTLQPGVYGGYTWVKSANYISDTGATLANHNINMFEISPALRAITHIGRGWYGTVGVRYAFNFLNGGKSHANGVKLADLGDRDFIEYGIGVEKSIDRFNVGINIGRREIGRQGWNGGFNLKYIF